MKYYHIKTAMRKIYGIGETVFDIIFKNRQPLAAKPGGAMLNSLVSLGRVGLPVHFMSEYADDETGSLINSFLHSNGVDTSHVHFYRDGKTKLALAFLDDRNDASYTFYEKYPANRLDIKFPAVSENDIILFGSIYAITKDIRDKFIHFIKSASQSGALLIYDPNFRSAHSHELESLMPLILENISSASMVRGSDEDLYNIFGAATPDEAWEAVKAYCNCLVYTANKDGVHVRTESFKGRFPVKKITPVSTIGAGDNFNAGMIASIYLDNIKNADLYRMEEADWSRVIAMGVDFASEVCMSYENYVSEEFAARIR